MTNPIICETCLVTGKRCLACRVSALEARAAIIDTQKGQRIPQTPEVLREIMSQDAAQIEELDKQVARLKRQYANLLNKYNNRGTQRNVFNELLVRVRNAFADYQRAEGCSCCRNDDNHKEAEKRLATLLNVSAYKDGSGFDFSPYRTEE